MKRRNYFGKAFIALALMLSVLISGCSENEVTDNLGDASDSGQTSITAELPATVPETEGSAPQTSGAAAAAEQSTELSSDTETGETAGTTTVDTTAKPDDTAKPTQTAVTTTKAEQTTVTTKPAQTTTVTTPKPAQTTVTTTKPAQTAVTTTKPPETTPPPQTTVTTAAPPPAPKPISSLLADYKSKWWYNHLNGDQQAVYKRLFETLSKGSNECDILDLDVSVDDLYAAISALYKESPQFLSMVFDYNYSYYVINSRKVVSGVIINLYTSNPQTQKLQQTVKDVIAGASKYSADYDRIKYVHDYIVETTVYDLNGGEYIHSTEGALVYNRAVCEGYARSFMYIMQDMGIPCICVEGYARGGNHIWNMVQLDGSWYHVDVTWDDLDGNNPIRYDYFLISDSNIKKTHSFTEGFVNPTAEKDYRK